MVVNLVGWACIIASWTIPQKWFSNQNKWLGTRLAFAAYACGLFIGAILNKLGL